MTEAEKRQKAIERSLEYARKYDEALKLVSKETAQVRVPPEHQLIFEYISTPFGPGNEYVKKQIFSGGFYVKTCGRKGCSSEAYYPLSVKTTRYEGLSEEIEEIIKKYDEKLEKLSKEYMYTPVCDGSKQTLTLGTHHFEGNNFLIHSSQKLKELMKISKEPSVWERPLILTEIFEEINTKTGEYRKGLL